MRLETIRVFHFRDVRIERFHCSRNPNALHIYHNSTMIIQTMNRLMKMLEGEYEDIQIKVDRFLSSEGIDGLGDQPFVNIF